MLSAEEIRKRLADYILRETPLDEFEDWLVSSSWDVRQTSPVDAQKLVFQVESRLSEYSGDHISEDALRRALTELIQSVEVVIGGSPPILDVRTGSSQSFSSTPAELQIGSVDIRPAVACV